jgi:hypothetical protein
MERIPARPASKVAAPRRATSRIMIASVLIAARLYYLFRYSRSFEQIRSLTVVHIGF